MCTSPGRKAPKSPSSVSTVLHSWRIFRRNWIKSIVADGGLDIFGIQVPTQQGADILAHQLGARIATPDLFRGKPWELSKFPPPDRDEFLGWIGKYQWPAIEPDLLKTIGFLREEGAKHIGTVPPVTCHLWRSNG
jgi:hypothetical protein